MQIDLDPKMRDFIVEHFKKRIAFRKKHMPDPNYVDPILSWAEHKDEAEARAVATEQKRKALEFIHNATLVIELLEEK